jgi:transglutaminase-like putative cysteine protease
MSVLGRRHPARRVWPPEDSILLRVAATGAVSTGIAACAAQGELSWNLALVTGALVVVGNAVSHLFRRRTLPPLKFALGATMVGAFAWFFFTVSAQASRGVLFSVEQPLAALFALMQAAHSFDVPSRRDLGFSLAGSATLIAVAAAQAVDLAFGLFVLTWAVFAALGLAAAWSSMAGVGRPRLRQVLLPAAAVAVVAAAAVALLPPPHAPSPAASALFGGSSGSAEPSHLAPAATAGAQRRAQPTGAANVGGYLGFAGALDTAIRPSLGNEVVLRVRADRPSYWLAETFDTWSGRSWSETGPRPGAPASRAGSDASGASGHNASGASGHIDNSAEGIAATNESSQPSASRWHTLDGGSPFLVEPALAGPPPPVPDGSEQAPLGASTVGGGGTSDYQTFYLATAASNLVLHASHASVVWFPSPRLYVSSDGTIESPETLGAGSAYSVLSTVTAPTPAQLSTANGRAGLTPGVLASSLELPRAYRRVGALARRITADRSTVYAKVTALEHWIATHTKYTTRIPPLAPGQDTVDQFLFVTRRGYCEQISTSLAVMLRTLGIPAREAVGYVPGRYNPITGLYDEQAKDAHAWVQVWFPGYGWQSFDPTAFVPVTGPNPGTTLAHDILSALRRIPVAPTAPIAGILALTAFALWWRRRRPTSWRAAVTRELERAAHRAGIASTPADTLGTLAAHIDAVLDGRETDTSTAGGSSAVGSSAVAVAAAAERAAWQSVDPDRATARRHVRHARDVRRAVGARTQLRAKFSSARRSSPGARGR